MKVDQVRDSVNCREDEVRYFVKIVDVVRVDQVRVDQVGCSRGEISPSCNVGSFRFISLGTGTEKARSHVSSTG